MVNYYDISQWEEHLYYGTGGTRDKTVVENPDDGCLYYFKTSLKKKVIDYKYEFWSEIIASEIGDSLEFDILHYDVAWRNDRLFQTLHQLGVLPAVLGGQITQSDVGTVGSIPHASSATLTSDGSHGRQRAPPHASPWRTARALPHSSADGSEPLRHEESCGGAYHGWCARTPSRGHADGGGHERGWCSWSCA